MSPPPTARCEHWQSIYGSRGAEALSWYRPHLEVSLELLRAAGLSAASRLIDIGGGASTLVDDLLDLGVRNLTVLDISSRALALAQERLGSRAVLVRWIAEDLLARALPVSGFDFWHDRAVLHFLSEPAELAAYAQVAAEAVAPGGHALIAGFAPNGPQRCSGLPVTRRSPEQIAALLAPAFSLLQTRTECHRTPSGAEQWFAYALLRRQ